MISCFASNNLIGKVALCRTNVSWIALYERIPRFLQNPRRYALLHRGSNVCFQVASLSRRTISNVADSTHLTGESVDASLPSACDQPVDDDLSSQHRSTIPRNKKLAAIIREGVVALNQTATFVQNNVQTTKSVFSSPEEDSKPDVKQLSEEHRIFSTAQKCLEDMCRRDPSCPLMAGGEPIMLLGVRVKPSFSHADLFWSLPYVVLSAPELNERQREFLKEKMGERIQGAPGRMLIQRINAVLSSYYPPKIRFKEAPPLLVYQVMMELEEE